MPEIKKRPDGTYKFSIGLDAHTNSPVADFKKMAEDSSIKMIFAIDEYGTIMSYNHPLTDAKDRLENKTTLVPYPADAIWDLATITLIIYQEKKEAEVGSWIMSGGQRIMVS